MHRRSILQSTTAPPRAAHARLTPLQLLLLRATWGSSFT